MRQNLLVILLFLTQERAVTKKPRDASRDGTTITVSHVHVTCHFKYFKIIPIKTHVSGDGAAEAANGRAAKGAVIVACI